jgi:predicted dehydrogenase
MSGGVVIINIVSHMVYFVCDCFGLPQIVSANAKSVYSALVEDEALVSLTHHSGIAGEIQASWSVPGKPILELGLSVRGEFGTITVNRQQIDMHLDKAWHTYSTGSHRIHASSIPSSALYDFSPEYDGEAYYAEDLDFIKCCVSRVPYAVPFDTSLRVEEIVAAVYESSRSGTEIELPGGEQL